MFDFQHLMVGLSRSAEDAGLIRYTARVASWDGVKEVRFVHVQPAAPAAEPHERVLADIQAATKTSLTGLSGSAHVSWEVLAGPLLDRLLEVAAEKEKDVLLVGHRRDHPGRSALARRLAMKAPCSVWMVPGGAAADIRRILVPIDFSGHAADTLRVATRLAQRLGLKECLALHVYFNEATVTFEGYDTVIRGQEDKAFRDFLTPIDCRGVCVTPLFEEGANVAHAIGRVAEREGVDLIVMGTRGRSRSASILLGSVTEDTIIDTRIPLLVVKHFGARMGVLEALLDKSFRQRRGPRFD